MNDAKNRPEIAPHLGGSNGLRVADIDFVRVGRGNVRPGPSRRIGQTTGSNPEGMDIMRFRKGNEQWFARSRWIFGDTRCQFK